MKLLVVILCYKVPGLTIDCLRSLSKAIGRVPGARVAVCENGSGPEAADLLRRAIFENGWGDWVELTVLRSNLGFTGGNNLVIRSALRSADPPRYVLLLNADTVVEEHALEALVDFMDRHPDAGIAGSRLLSPEGTVQASPFRFPGVASELDRGLRLGVVSRLLSNWAVVLPTPTEAVPCDWVAGASMILRRSMLEDVGLLDEGLFTYFDDVDLGLRARRLGWQTWAVPESRVVHLEGASTGVGTRIARRLPPYWFQARRRLFLKHFGPVRSAMADAAFLVGYALDRLRRRIQRKPDLDPPHLLGDSFRHSVFRTGFRLREVDNPALAGAGTPKADAGTSLKANVLDDPRPSVGAGSTVLLRHDHRAGA